MNRMNSPYFCANGCISEFNNGSCKHYLPSSSSESSFDGCDRKKILVDVTIEHDVHDERIDIPCAQNSIRKVKVVPAFLCSNE